MESGDVEGHSDRATLRRL